MSTTKMPSLLCKLPSKDYMDNLFSNPELYRVDEKFRKKHESVLATLNIRDIVEELLTDKLMNILLFIDNPLESGLFNQYDINRYFLNVGNTNGMLLKYIPYQFRSEEICIEYVRNTPSAIVYVPTELPNYEDIVIKYALKYRPELILFIKEEFITEKMGLECVRLRGSSIQYIPLNVCTIEMCNIAIEDSDIKKLTTSSINNNVEPYFNHIVKVFKLNTNSETELKELYTNLVDKLIDKEPIIVKYLNHNLYNNDLLSLYKKAVSKNGFLLNYYYKNTQKTPINKSYSYEELYDFYLTAVIQNGKVIKYIPNEFKDDNLIREAVTSNFEAIQFIKKEKITKELYLLVLSHKIKESLNFLDEKLLEEFNIVIDESDFKYYFQTKYYYNLSNVVSGKNHEERLEILKKIVLENQTVEVINMLNNLNCGFSEEFLRYAVTVNPYVINCATRKDKYYMDLCLLSIKHFPESINNIKKFYYLTPEKQDILFDCYNKSKQIIS